MINLRGILCAIGMGLLVPAGASAKLTPVLPGGNSSAYQYVESIPTAHGSQPTGDVHHSGSNPSGPSLASLIPRSTQQSLANDGAAGRNAATLAAATAPTGVHHRPGIAQHASRKNKRDTAGTASSGSSSGSGPSGGSAGGSGSSAGSAVADTLTGGGGSLLPVVLIAIAVAAVAIVALGRRFRSN